MPDRHIALFEGFATRSGLAAAALDENGGVGCVGHVWKGNAMEKVSLTALARHQLETARAGSSGRSAHTVYGGHEHNLRQTLIALTAGSAMDDHESPGEATLEVLQGRVRVTNSTTGWDGSPGDLIVLPRERHGLRAVEDSVVLLTVSKPVGPHT